jgi:hypothetical protein
LSDDTPQAIQVAAIVGAARSGTTLLRLILDSHSEIGCPAEAGIPALVDHAARVWQTVDESGTGCAPPRDIDEPAAWTTASAMPAYARDKIRRAVLAPMSYYCHRERKRMYCDKSLDSVHHLEPFSVIFPEARYILIFRQVMDTIASGLEASPWGFSAFGYAPFVQRSTDNFVAALANYWLKHVTKALAWESQHPERCARVLYEELVGDPTATTARIMAFLGVDDREDVLTPAFEATRLATGPGDHKVRFTSGVHARSVGRGKRVPVELLPPPLLEGINARLVELGYGRLGPGWNTEPDGRPDADLDGGEWGHRLADAMGEAQRRMEADLPHDDPSFAIVAQDVLALRWVCRPNEREMYQGAVAGRGQPLGNRRGRATVAGNCLGQNRLVSGQFAPPTGVIFLALHR